MKKLTILSTYLLFTLLFSANVIADNFIVVKADIYQITLDDPGQSISQTLAKANDEQLAKLLNENNLVEQPKLIVKRGKPATIEIGSQNNQGKDVTMTRLTIHSKMDDPLYLVEFELVDDGFSKVSSVQASLNSVIVLSSEIKQQAQVVKIATKTFANIESAQVYINGL